MTNDERAEIDQLKADVATLKDGMAIMRTRHKSLVRVAEAVKIIGREISSFLHARPALENPDGTPRLPDPEPDERGG